MSELCNLSMTLEGSPDTCKIGKVKPLFKKGSNTESSNDRLVSMVP